MNFLRDLPAGVEIRRISHPVEIRATGARPVLFGYASKFGTFSEFMSAHEDWRETIDRGAFDGVLNDDVRALWNHNTDFPLARCRNGRGSLRLSVDSIGLKYEFEVPATSYGHDLIESVRRGDVDQSSFGFSGCDVKWDTSGAVKIRHITRIKRLWDVSPVCIPAYPDATIALNEPGARSAHDIAADHRRRQIELAEADAGVSARPSTGTGSAQQPDVAAAHRRRQLQIASLA